MSELLLLVRNYHGMLSVDPKHWERVKEIAWLEKGGKIVSPTGKVYEDFFPEDFEGKKPKCGFLWDKRIESYIPESYSWTYSEYYNKFILIPLPG